MRVDAGYVARPSLSARRAWIEIASQSPALRGVRVALRKESVDRNTENAVLFLMTKVALRKESVDRNCPLHIVIGSLHGRSPQGERG